MNKKGRIMHKWRGVLQFSINPLAVRPTGQTKAEIWDYLDKYGPARSREVAQALHKKLRVEKCSIQKNVSEMSRAGFLVSSTRLLDKKFCEWCGEACDYPYHLKKTTNHVETEHSFCSVECRDHYEQRSIGVIRNEIFCY